MRSAATFLAIAVVLTPTLAWSDWRYAHWGATPEQLAQASGGAVKVLPPAKRKAHANPWNSLTAAEGVLVEGPLRLDLSFSFDSKTGGLNCIIFNSSDQSHNELMKQLFLRQNGPPKATKNYPDLGMETFEWRAKQDEIGLTLMKDGGSFATQCLAGTNPPVE